MDDNMSKTVELTIDLTRPGIVSLTNGDKTYHKKAVVALSEDRKTVVAAGKEADSFSRLAYPLDGSVVVDFGRTEGMFRIFLKSAIGDVSLFTRITATVIVKLPLTMIELKALNDSLEHAGISAVHFVCVDPNGEPSPWLS